MDAEHLLLSLQLSDTFFPTGAFAHSDGLESAVASGTVVDIRDIEEWLQHYLYEVFVPCEAVALIRAMRTGTIEELREIDAELTAIRPAATARDSNRSLGKRFLKSVLTIRNAPEFNRMLDHIDAGVLDGNAPVVYGVVFSTLGLTERNALLAFGYMRLAGMVSAALRLISAGQQQGQAALRQALEYLPAAVERALDGDPAITSFTPELDVHQMNHRYVYSRLFRS